MRCPYLSKRHPVSVINSVLADVHQLTEQNLPDLRESLAHRVHQSFEDGGDVGLHIAPKNLLCTCKHQGCTQKPKYNRETAVKMIEALTNS